MNNVGCITLGVPGGPCVCISFDSEKKTSSITYHREPPDVEYKTAELALSRICKRIPGSYRTARLRKKRRKAVMSLRNTAGSRRDMG